MALPGCKTGPVNKAESTDIFLFSTPLTGINLKGNEAEMFSFLNPSHAFF